MSTTKTTSALKGNGTAAPKWDAQATFAELAGIGRENFDAFVKASTIAAQGYGAITQHWMDFAKSTVEQSVETARAVMSTKNVKDALELQSGFARAAFDRYVDEANKISELSVKTATDALAPIQKRVDEVVAKYSRAA
ncbi:MAG: phasin family protein [Alphaproteobacteria bacterium]